ncbi:Trafficking protein particle complex subunit 4 [Nosema bombycis CQ1]|uniref:Trafficking protein particle complex subunit n=1 Tax=Nosema bombycis (strain CQ1 / CVCC 102059) TaxID=578461 RepID=R0KNN3_NOSB1|nr:Trafficking protein particle complex subunit 4 [Nosema bombycis CQ1]|eukprot:EOB12291.1 Trafficking protein particle complex subunit 4 [Nosema bombycis CQ1]
MISYFFILNSSGSMIFSYQKSPKFDTNSLLVLCSSLHSLKYLISEISKPTHKDKFYFESQTISMYTTLTGISFIFVGNENTNQIFKKIYGDFCNFVMLDPFYILGMPINCEKFRPEQYF